MSRPTSRRRVQEEQANHERWAIPYADLMTLLLALFVVMYAVSAVNQHKYKAMAVSMHDAFGGGARGVAPARAGQPVQPMPSPHVHRSVETDHPAHIRLPVPTHAQASAAPDAPAAASRGMPALKKIADDVQRAMQPLIRRKEVVVRRNKFWIEIDIRTDILFPSGIATPQPAAAHILRQLAGVLSRFPNPLRVEGYTDDKPINTRLYPSNWELSAARAAGVVRLLADDGVDPDRLGIVGWGEYRPVASNDSATGRNRNRRVTVTVLSNRGVPARFYSDAHRLPAKNATVPDTTTGISATPGNASP